MSLIQFGESFLRNQIISEREEVQNKQRQRRKEQERKRRKRRESPRTQELEIINYTRTVIFFSKN